jgi:hypothetical protein
MDNLVMIKDSKRFFKTPDVSCNIETGKCEIIGESFMENSGAFFERIFEWITNYNQEYSHKPLVIDIKLTYFNTSTSKMLFELLNLIQNISIEGQKVEVNWYYDTSDEEVYEDIIDLCYDVDLKVNIIPQN